MAKIVTINNPDKNKTKFEDEAQMAPVLMRYSDRVEEEPQSWAEMHADYVNTCVSNKVKEETGQKIACSNTQKGHRRHRQCMVYPHPSHKGI